MMGGMGGGRGGMGGMGAAAPSRPARHELRGDTLSDDSRAAPRQAPSRQLSGESEDLLEGIQKTNAGVQGSNVQQLQKIYQEGSGKSAKGAGMF